FPSWPTRRRTAIRAPGAGVKLPGSIQKSCARAGMARPRAARRARERRCVFFIGWARCGEKGPGEGGISPGPTWSSKVLVSEARAGRAGQRRGEVREDAVELARILKRAVGER